MEDTLGLNAAITNLLETGKALAATTLLKGTPERTGVYYLVGPDGKAEMKVADPDWHRELLATPSDLRRFIENVADHNDGTTFYDEQKITFVFDLDDRRNLATTTLVPTPQYIWLAQKSGQTMTQKDFVRLLRINFRSATDGTLLGLVRNLKFSSNADAAGSIQQGRESMGRSIVNEVRGESAIPEEVALTIPIFENHPFMASVNCAVEVITAEQTFKLTPFPLSLKIAMDSALADIAELLSAEGLPPLYRGSPS